MPTDTRRSTGLKGEEAAARFLTRSGYEILDKNVRTRAGEIDLVAREGKTLVFVEVKTRKDVVEGDPPQAAVNTRKQNRLGKLAQRLSQAEAHPADAVPLRRGRGHLQRRGRRQGHPPHPERLLRRTLVGAPAGVG